MGYKTTYHHVNYYIPKSDYNLSTQCDAVEVDFTAALVVIQQGADTIEMTREQASALASVMVEIDSMIAEVDAHNAN